MNENGNVVDETCDEVNTECSPAHWVEKLFPPTFRLSLQEPVYGSITPAVLDRYGCECNLPDESHTAARNEELFAKLAQGISPLDVASIKNVYQRVWLMTQEASAAARSMLLHYIYPRRR